MKSKKILCKVIPSTIFALGLVLANSVPVTGTLLQNESLLINEHCQTIDMSGTCPGGVGSSGRESSGNTSTRFWSNHTTREHRPFGTIRTTIETRTVQPATWGRPLNRHFSAWTTHAPGATFTNAVQTR